MTKFLQILNPVKTYFEEMSKKYEINKIESYIISGPG